VIGERAYKGLWWLPGDDSDKLPGTLTIKRGEASLELLGHFGHAFVRETETETVLSGGLGEHPRILGLTSEGKPMTLEGHISAPYTEHFPGIPVATYSRSVTLIGKHFAEGERIGFDEIAICRHEAVLCRPRPTNKSLSDPLAGASPAQELGQSRGGKTVCRDRSEEGEHRLALAQVDVGDFLPEASMPPRRRPLELLRLTVSEEQRELERLRQRDELELRSGRQGFGDVAAVESSTEAHVRRALSSHERMFPWLSTLCKHRSSRLHGLARAYYGH
jgi:hypothetical protein